jgi:AraC-like DNA-binding protein
VDFDLAKASKKLCELDLNFTYDGLNINVLWFRSMVNTGEWVIERHMHSSYEFHFIKSGSCEVITDTARFTVQEGEFYLTASNVFHEQRSINNSRFIEYSLNCDLNIQKDTPAEMLNLFNSFKSAQCIAYKDESNCCQVFNNVLEEAYFERAGFFSSIKNYIPLLLINTARNMPRSRDYAYSIPKKNSSNTFRMSQIERFINDNISTPISTSSIATYMHLSQKQICRIIRESENMSTKEFVNSMKLIKAKELLKNSSLHIKKIADLLGFSSEYYFSQFFKNLEGYPPGVFRENILHG